MSGLVLDILSFSIFLLLAACTELKIASEIDIYNAPPPVFFNKKCSGKLNN